MSESLEKSGGSSGEDAPNFGKIFAAIGPKEIYSEEDQENLKKLEAEPVDFFSTFEEREARNQKHGGVRNYVISSISEKNKASRGYHDCIGVAAVGVDVKTGKNVSFLTHQPPRNIGNPVESDFDKDFAETLRTFYSQVKKDSIDVVFFGGQYHEMAKMPHVDLPLGNDYGYKTSIKLLADAVQKALHTEPNVITGPNHDLFDSTEVVFDTKHRRLYMYQPEQPRSISGKGFPASGIEEATKDWKPLLPNDE